MKVCVTIDMDNFAEYESLVAAEAAPSGASFYDDALPRFLDLFESLGIRATFFAIGRDLARRDHARALREAARRGHEIGNHSFSHPYNFRSLPREAKVAEIEQAEAAIADAIGERPVGFRTPSCDVDLETLRLLAERGYAYDSSVFPSWLMWAFMAYGRLFVRRRDYQLGSAGVPFAPARPYRPSARRLERPAAGHEDAPDILEIPFSVVPGLRIPYYTTFFRMFPPRLFELGVRAYGRQRGELHVLLHLIDLADFSSHDLARALARTPGVGIAFERRRRFIERAMRAVAAAGEAVPLRELAREARAERAA